MESRVPETFLLCFSVKGWERETESVLRTGRKRQIERRNTNSKNADDI